jgi:hypothetical protein
MKNQLTGAFLASILLAGCASKREPMGAASGNDPLAGRPVIVINAGRGTRIRPQDLPQAINSTLQRQAPGAEISSIQKEDWNGRAVYKINFIDKIKYPTMYIAEDGSEVQSQTK